MKQLLMLRGLPGSGKTTHAKELVEKSAYTRVNKDDLRAMLHNGKWSRNNERAVLEVRDNVVVLALKEGRNVVVDDTNFHPKHEERLRDIAAMTGADFKSLFIDTPIEECLERNLKRANPVREKVIWDMYNQYLRPAPEVYVPPADAPPAIVCDIDGTLAHGIGVSRKPYEWHKVDTDTLDETVAGILHIYDPSRKIILLSGRDSSCREATETWLKKHNIYYDHLYMRAAGDSRKDFIIKRELFDEYIRDNYNVEFMLDDRDQVVEMWRQMGLKVLQVAEGDF